MERERLKPGTYKFWTYIIISIGKKNTSKIGYLFIALTLFAGLMSGLTVGYLSIDELVL